MKFFIRKSKNAKATGRGTPYMGAFNYIEAKRLCIELNYYAIYRQLPDYSMQLVEVNPHYKPNKQIKTKNI